MQTTATVGPAGQIRVPTDALIVVCDGQSSLFLRNAGSAVEPKFERVTSVERPNPPTSEQVTDKPGRFNDGPSVHRSSTEETDRHALEKQRFARSLAEMLHQAARGGAYDDLVLVAPPSVLGELRQHMHSDVQQRLLVEIEKLLKRNLPRMSAAESGHDGESRRPRESHRGAERGSRDRHERRPSHGRGPTAVAVNYNPESVFDYTKPYEPASDPKRESAHAAAPPARARPQRQTAALLGGLPKKHPPEK